MIELCAALSRVSCASSNIRRHFCFDSTWTRQCSGLVGSANELRHSPKTFPASGSLSEHLGEIGLADSGRLLGCFLCGEKDLQQYAGNAPINTDDFPRLIFDAPNYSYKRHVSSYATLTNLLAGIPISLPNLLEPATTEFKESLRAYLSARNEYLKGLIQESEGQLDEVVDRYIASSRLNSRTLRPVTPRCVFHSLKSGRVRAAVSGQVAGTVD